MDADIGKKDITPEQYAFIKKYIEGIEYGDYDKLSILCDALTDANGCCILEKRFNGDTIDREHAAPARAAITQKPRSVACTDRGCCFA